MSYENLKITYPELPVVEHREEFFEMLEKHQVVIVKADTGSGKSTQLPKFLLEWYSSKGEARAHTSEREARPHSLFKIGVTEPRRLAAISIADRLREELKDETLVSTKIRFWEQGQSDAPIKVMTDGILLQEFRRDRLFRQYSAIVIDEAHERSLNIDILLGIFKTVLQARPEFKLIVASATLDAKLFEEFYDNSCVLEAEGRTFPVDVEYFLDERRKTKEARGVTSPVRAIPACLTRRAMRFSTWKRATAITCFVFCRRNATSKIWRASSRTNWTLRHSTSCRFTGA